MLTALIIFGKDSLSIATVYSVPRKMLYSAVLMLCNKLTDLKRIFLDMLPLSFTFSLPPCRVIGTFWLAIQFGQHVTLCARIKMVYCYYG